MKNLQFNIEELLIAQKIEKVVPSYHCEAIDDAARQQNLVVSFSIALVENEVLLEAAIEGDVTLECCRCLETYRHPITLRFRQGFPLASTEINIEKELREQLVLVMPEKPLCSTDCAGLCAHCGVNKNVARCSCNQTPLGAQWEALHSLANARRSPPAPPSKRKDREG